MELAVGFVIAAVLFIAEYLLCTKLKSPLWGGMIPVLILAGTIWIFASGRIPLETRYVFPFVVLNTLLFGNWGTGRDKYKKMKQEEMERMKARVCFKTQHLCAKRQCSKLSPSPKNGHKTG